MARRKLIWHLGLAQPARSVIEANLATYAATLDEAGSRVVATPEQARLATHELLRTHRSAGLRRAEVEGFWARITDRVWAHQGVSLLSTPDLCAADKDQLRMALDPLIGVEVHLVITLDSWSQQLYGGWLAELRSGHSTTWEKYVARVLERVDQGAPGHRQAEDFWAGHELVSILARWGWTFHADRLHVVVARDPARRWTSFLEVAGLADVPGLDAVVPPYADPAGVAVLRRVNRQLDESVPEATSDLLTRGDDDLSALPVVDTTLLHPLVDRWDASFASSGYDLRGSLEDLLDEVAPTSLPGPRDQLGAAVDALAEALADNSRLRSEVSRLEADNQQLDEKRRKHKRRLRSLVAKN